MAIRWYSLLLLCPLAACDRPEPPAPRGTDFVHSARAAEEALSTGRPEDARTIARRLAEVHGASPEAHELHARAATACASFAPDAATRRESLEEAADAYSRACELAPQWAGIHHAAGVVEAELGRPEAARARYREARGAEPGNPQFALYEGLASLALKEPAEARAALEAAHALAPSAAIPLAALAECELMSGDPEKALARAREARSLDPSDRSLRVAEAKALRALGRHAEVLTLLEPLPAAERAQAAVAHELAHAHSALGNHAEAAKAWELRAVADPRALIEAAAAWHAAGDDIRAHTALDSARAAGAGGERLEEVDALLSGASGPRPPG